MEEMTDIVTTFYSLEGASKGVAIERWALDDDKLYQTYQSILLIHFLCIFKSQWNNMCLFSGLKQFSNSWTLMGMGALTKKSFASKVSSFFLQFLQKS